MALSLAGTSSLSVISLTRMFGVVFPKMKVPSCLHRKFADHLSYFFLAAIWIFATISAFPTIKFRRYWVSKCIVIVLYTVNYNNGNYIWELIYIHNAFIFTPSRHGNGLIF